MLCAMVPMAKNIRVTPKKITKLLNTRPA